MQPIKRIILWIALAIACALPASALTPSALENRVWENLTGTLETHQEATPQVPQSHQEETTATAENALECFLAAEETPALAGSIRNVNPLNGDMNCVNCALATDSTLAGQPASALLSGPKNIYSAIAPKSSWADVSGQMEIGSILSQGGNGARGIVYGASPTGSVGHVFNAVNQNGTIRFLDGQIGGLGVDNFDNFTNFKFLLTHPGGG